MEVFRVPETVSLRMAGKMKSEHEEQGYARIAKALGLSATSYRQRFMRFSRWSVTSARRYSRNWRLIENSSARQNKRKNTIKPRYGPLRRTKLNLSRRHVN